MTNGRMQQGLGLGIGLGIGLKVGSPLLIGLVTLVAAHFGGMQVGNSLVLAAVVAFAVAFVFFIVDTEIRISAIGERVAAGLTQIGRLAELSGMMERSSLGPALLADFMETAGRWTAGSTRCSSASRDVRLSE
jgi:hypothetical protein